MTRLSVNINKIATIRNARGGNIPDILLAAKKIQEFGGQGITVHPRPDERHIRFNDVFDLRPIVTTEFNIEGYPSQEFIEMVQKVRPDQVTLVPDPPNVLTSNAGWNTVENKALLIDVIKELKLSGARVSIFVDTVLSNVENAADTGTDRIELYTEPYADNYRINRDDAIAPFVKAAEVAIKNGLGINAGHDLNLDNLYYFHKNIPGLLEVSIGHALISDSLYLGLEETVRRYLGLLK